MLIGFFYHTTDESDQTPDTNFPFMSNVKRNAFNVLYIYCDDYVWIILVRYELKHQFPTSLLSTSIDEI